jgi:hypothetical protein
MAVTTGSQPHQWISWTNVALGVWLVVSAFWVSRSGDVVPENIIAGSLVALTALWSARAFTPVVSLIASWTVVFGGLWVAAAPFALGYRGLAAVNDLVVGLALMGLGTANVIAKARRSSDATGSARLG